MPTGFTTYIAESENAVVHMINGNREFMATKVGILIVTVDRNN